jgi:hypothetical protein
MAVTISEELQTEATTMTQTHFAFRTQFDGFLSFLRKNKLPVGLLTVAYIFLLAIIGMQNVPFWDDSMRNLSGVSGWGSWDGRWGSELVGRALNAGRPMVDIGITSFIVSGIVLAAAATLVVWILVASKANWLTWVIALCFGLNPWILNALAFRFDGPFMAFSVLFAAAAMLWYRTRYLWFFLACAGFAFVVANFFQSSIGLILTLLLTRALLDWVNRREPNRVIASRVGLGFAGVALGVVAYFIQALVFGTGRSGWFDLRNPFGAFANNLFHFIRVFLLDNANSWLLFTVAMVVLAIFVLLSQSQRRLWQVLLAIPVYLGVSILASGGVLLFATAEHISVQARFRFPLAMGLAMLAMIASTAGAGAGKRWVNGSKVLRLVATVILLGFAYLWLMVVPLFANVLREQQDTLRFQASMIFSDAFQVYRPGDMIVYDPNIFINSRHFARVGERFPIFANTTYVGVINQHNDTVRDRLIALLGLPAGTLVATNDLPEACTFRNPDIHELVITGSRWEIWRATENVVCVTFPPLADLYVNEPARQELQVNWQHFPFAPTEVIDIANVNTGQLQMAIWSLINPGDVQWVFADSLENGNAIYVVPAPPTGWEGHLLVAHFFIDGEFMFQQIWQLPG